MENCKNKIIQLRWIGRFGNRMFQYVFGCAYAKKFNCLYYIPSEWEGSYLFCENKYCKIITNDMLRLYVNQTQSHLQTPEYIKYSLEKYNDLTGDTVEFVSIENKENIGKTNIAFNDLHCMYFSHCYDLVDDELITEIFSFNEKIINSDMYNWYNKNKYTYDVVHLRRGDVASINFQGPYSMISKNSYLKQIDFLGWNKDEIIWISDDESERTMSPLHKYCKTQGHKWEYPRGEFFLENTDYFFDFLPDFLLMYFARKIIRGNSSFGWWACCLSNAEIYSPIIISKPPECNDRYYEMETGFTKGNHMHFVGNKFEHLCFNDIVFTNCKIYNK